MLRTLAQLVAKLSGHSLGYLSDGANAAGAWLAGALPHRGPAMQRVEERGMDALAMMKKRIRAYMFLGLEPELDTWDGHAARMAVERAGLVVALTSFRSALFEEHAHIMLPVAAFAESDGTYVNAEGQWQGFAPAVKPPGEARPGWKVLRVLGNALQLPGFEYMQAAEACNELRALVGEQRPVNVKDVPPGALLYKVPGTGTERVTTVPMYSVDVVVRHSPALQATGHVADDRLRISPSIASALNLTDGDSARVTQGDVKETITVQVDARLPANTVLVHGAGPLSRLGPAFGAIKVERA